MQNCYTISKFNQYSANSLSLWGDTSTDLIKPTQKENSSWFYTQHLTWDSQKACNVLVHCLYKRLSVSLLNRDKASKLYSPIHQEYCIQLQIMILLWSHLHLFQIRFKEQMLYHPLCFKQHGENSCKLSWKWKHVAYHKSVL